MCELLASHSPAGDHVVFGSGGTHLGGVATAVMSTWRRLSGGQIDVVAGDSLYRFDSTLILPDKDKKTIEMAVVAVEKIGSCELSTALEQLSDGEEEEYPHDDEREGDEGYEEKKTPEESLALLSNRLSAFLSSVQCVSL